MQGVERSVAHMLSGMYTGGGIAYIGTLCDWHGNRAGSNSYGELGCSAAGLCIAVLQQRARQRSAAWRALGRVSTCLLACLPAGYSGGLTGGFNWNEVQVRAVVMLCCAALHAVHRDETPARQTHNTDEHSDERAPPAWPLPARPQTSNPASVVWDISVVIHELGHSYNSVSCSTLWYT